MSTPTNPDGKYVLTLPSDTYKINIITHTSGNAQYINYCDWVAYGQTLVKWKVESGKVSVEKDPSRITNSHCDVSLPTSKISTERVINSSFQFSHQRNSSSPIDNNLLNVSTLDVSDNLRIVILLADDTNDRNYLDFQMVIVIYH